MDHSLSHSEFLYRRLAKAQLVHMGFSGVGEPREKESAFHRKGPQRGYGTFINVYF